MSDEDIRDLPQIQELLEDAHAFEELQETLPVLRPVLEQEGVDVDGLESLFEEEDIDELISQAR